MVYASGRDVTQELLAERALASSENRYRTLVDGLPDTAVFLVDGDLRVEFAAGQPLHDGTITPAEFIGQAVDAILPEPESAALVDACSAALAGEERSLDIVAAGHGHALWLRTSPLPGDEPGTGRGRDAHRPGHPRARRARARDERRPGALPAGLRGRADRHGGGDARRALPRGQPGPLRDHGLRGRRADRHDVLAHHPSRGRRPRPRGHAPAHRRRAQLVRRREALSASGRLGRVGRPQRHARARRRRAAAAPARPDPGHHAAPALRARAATARRPRSADRPAQPPPLRAGARPPRRRGRALRAARRAARARPRPLQVHQRRARPPCRRRAHPVRRGAPAGSAALQRHARPPRRRRVRRAAAQRRRRRGRAGRGGARAAPCASRRP